MFDFIPIDLYVPIFNYLILCMVLVAVYQSSSGIIFKENITRLNSFYGFIFTVFLILYIGLRPISAYFADTAVYTETFLMYANSPKEYSWEGEWFFNNLMIWFAKHSDIQSFFLFCSTIYVGSVWVSCKRIFKQYNYIPYLVILGMFTFILYGVNGVRNGMASSLFILAISFINKPIIAIILSIFSIGCHSTMYLLVGSAILAWFIKDHRIYMGGWIACILLSLTIGTQIQELLINYLPIDDARFESYLLGNRNDISAGGTSMEFRWDFLLYSSLGTITGWYYIERLKFKDAYYTWLYDIFLTSNAFWILVIRASFSNRFAQISWFIMPLILIYPLIKQRFYPNHESFLAKGILVFYAFTFIFNILLPLIQ